MKAVFVRGKAPEGSKNLPEKVAAIRYQYVVNYLVFHRIFCDSVIHCRVQSFNDLHS